MFSRPLLFATTALALSGSAFAASYTSDFSGLALGAPLDGYAGWTQSEANPPDDIDGSYPLAYGATVGGQPGAAISTSYAIPAGNSYSVSHTVGTPLATSELHASFSILDSSAFAFRNNFSIGIYSGSINLFSVDFTPQNTSTPPGGANDAWDITFSSDAGSFTSGILGSAVEDGLYTLDVYFNVVGADIRYTAKVAGSNTYAGFGTLVGLAGANVSDLVIGTSIGTDANWGDNSFNFTAVQVPEPTSVALLGLGGMGLFLRRRRA